MFSVAFFGLMRCGEITVSKQGQVIIQINQLSLTRDKATINIINFKHNKFMKPVNIPMQKFECKKICPVYNLALFFTVMRS